MCLQMLLLLFYFDWLIMCIMAAAVVILNIRGHGLAKAAAVLFFQRFMMWIEAAGIWSENALAFFLF